jgi:hypothetical protein
MASSVSRSDAPMQPNTLRTRLDALRPTSAKARIDPNVPDQKAILEVIKQTKSELCLSSKEMAIAAGISESEFSDALNGKDNRRFDAEWLWRQSDAFLIRFLDNVTEARQLTPEQVSTTRRKRIVELIDLLLQETA